MNLYSIIFTHYSPKDSEDGIKILVLAENDEQVYMYIASEPSGIYNSWSENEKDDVDISDDEDHLEGFKSRMLRLKGEVNDDSVELSDLYYGRTLYGWELIVENTKTDYSELISLGFIVQL